MRPLSPEKRRASPPVDRPTRPIRGLHAVARPALSCWPRLQDQTMLPTPPAPGFDDPLAIENSELLPQAVQLSGMELQRELGARMAAPRCQLVKICRTSVRVLASAPRFSATMRRAAGPAGVRTRGLSREAGTGL